MDVVDIACKINLTISLVFANGNRPSQEPARRYFPLEGCLLHCCRNLDLFGYLQLVQLHLNLLQSKDVENLLRTEIHAGSTNFSWQFVRDCFVHV